MNGPPRIVTFEAPRQVERGSSITLRWKVSGEVARTTLNGEAVSGESCTRIASADPTRYDLVAESSAGTTSAVFYVGTHEPGEVVSEWSDFSPAPQLSEPRWAQSEHDHGAPAAMLVTAADLDGRLVRFWVEHAEGDDWRPYHCVTAAVVDGVAMGRINADHPVLGPLRTGRMSATDIKSAKPARLRFHAELLPAGG